MADKRWIAPPVYNADLVSKLSHSLNIGSDLAEVLINRGIDSYETAQTYFRPNLKSLHDPYLMLGMDKAVNRICKAIDQNERILIYGDYDVDGTSAVAVVYSFLSKIHSNIAYYIPDRYGEGYGISTKGIDYAAENNISLIIALDCGIKSVDKVAYANEKNIDFIICDHHLPDEELPAAYSILNPKQKNCNYPFKELPGCGIGFKLCQALAIKLNIPASEVEIYIDLVAVAISADIVPLVGENRILTYFGLLKLKENPNKGLQALLNINNENKPSYTVNDLVFGVTPKINAAGRMAHGNEAVALMTTGSEEKAKSIAESINVRNTDRKDVDQNITKEALEMLAQMPELQDKNSTLVYHPDWHKGVVGIVASRLIEKYYRPTIVLCSADGIASGSARSIEGFDLYAAIESCGDLLNQFGGHTFAAGMTLPVENINLFRERFEIEVTKRITPDMLIESVRYDAEIELNRISPKFLSIIKQMAPFGPHNMNPTFRSNNVWDTGYVRIVGNNHLQMYLTQEDGNKGIKAIAFNQAHHYETINKGCSFDICYTIEENHWDGKVYTQLNIKDLKLS
ncbi:MAG: single-stranded-DNA-specific exonuclease RecJ [Bacteroidetes bacterium]|nr:single-stranded-DNA-specific exonuclease RecJ [Bacteroidota bacterium]